jgi:hypothetical protein
MPDLELPTVIVMSLDVVLVVPSETVSLARNTPAEA